MKFVFSLKAPVLRLAALGTAPPLNTQRVQRERERERERETESAILKSGFRKKYT